MDKSQLLIRSHKERWQRTRVVMSVASMSLGMATVVTASTAVLATPPADAAITIPAPNSTTWQLNGTASASGGNLSMTPATAQERSSAWYKTAISVTGSLKISFTYVANSGNLTGGLGADGVTIGLIPTSQGDTALSTVPSNYGGSLGITGLTGVFATFDTFKDPVACSDPSANFVGILYGTIGTCDTGDIDYTGSKFATISHQLSNDSTNVTVTFNGGSSPSVVIDVAGKQVLSRSIPKASFPSGSAYLGVTAATGPDYQAQAINGLEVGTKGMTTAASKSTATGLSDASRYSPSTTCGSYPIDCASGDFWHTFTDASVPGYGPALNLTRTYNSANALTEGIFGFGWSSSYDQNLSIDPSTGDVTVTEADGSQTTAVDDSGTYTFPDSADSTLSLSGSTYTFVRQGTQIMTFNSTGQLTSISDPNGATTALSYTSGKLMTVNDPSSRTLTFTYGTNGLVSTVTDPLSRETQYFYNTSNELTSVEDPLTRVTSFTYDTGGKHLLLTMTMPNGQSGAPDAGDKVINTYDSYGRVLTQTDPNGQETTYAYSGDPTANFSDTGGTTTITDPDGNVEVENYVDGEMMTKTLGSSAWSYDYDPTTFAMTSDTDPNGNTTTATSDEDGNIDSTSNALGNATTSSFNSFNEQTCVATPLAANPCSALTPPSAITAGTATITPPSSAPPAYVTYTEYDTDGNNIYTTTGDYNPGSSTAAHSVTTYDLYNGESVTLSGTSDSCTTSAPSIELPCATISANQVVTQLTYDTHGDLTASSTPDGNSGGEVAKSTMTYDTDGEMTSSVAPQGNLSGATAANYTTSDTYDADGEVTAKNVASASGSTVIPRKTSYAYDGDGNVTSTTKSAPIQNIGSTSGTSSSGSLTLPLPAGTRSGDTAILSTTTSPSTSLRQLTANDIYTIAGNEAGFSGDVQQATTLSLNNPQEAIADSAGNIYIADSLDNEIREIAASNHTQWGITMTAGDMYRIAGSSSGASGTSGDTGAGTSALLHTPFGLALDTEGDLYIADQANSRIQELSAKTDTQWNQSMTSGHIYTVLGNSGGTSGTTGDTGLGTSAKLHAPSAVAVNANGDVYVADTDNNRIQELAATVETQWAQPMAANDVYTIAGFSTGSGGSTGDGGIGTSAKLNLPQGVALDPSGDVIISDANNSRIQELSALTRTQWSQSMTANDIYTIGGTAGSPGLTGDTGPASSSLFSNPGIVTVDGAGNIYIADIANNRVQEIAATTGSQWGQSMTTGDVYTVAGSATASSGDAGDGGAATSALFSNETGVALDNQGNLLIADPQNEVIREVDAQNSSQVPLTKNDAYTIAGDRGTVTSTNGVQATDDGLGSPQGTVVDSSGNVYISDYSENRIEEYAATTHSQWGISMVAGDLYTILGSSSGTAGSTGDSGLGTSAKLDGPQGIALDGAGDLYVADVTNQRVQELAASTGSQWGISMTANDVYTVAGTTGTSGTSANGTAATSADLSAPSDIAFDASGDMYIADASNNRVIEVPITTKTQWNISMAANEIFTVAGNVGGAAGHTGNSGVAVSAKLDGPQGVAVDSSGNLYIADTVNNRVQEVPVAAGTQWNISMTANDIYTVAGSATGSAGHTGDAGVATSGLLSGPTDVVIDAAGNIDLADTTNNRLQFVAAATGTQWGQSVSANDIYTFGGNSSATGGYGGDGGVGTSAYFATPTGIAVDGSGDVYVADTDNSLLRELVKSNVGAAQTTSTPTGAALVNSATVGTTTTSVFREDLVSGVDGLTVSFSTDAPVIATLTLYRGVFGDGLIDGTSNGTTSSGTSVSASAFSTTDPGDETVFVGGAGQLGTAATWTAPSGFASEVANTANAPLSEFVADAPGPAPDGSNGGSSATSSSIGQLTGVLFDLNPGIITSTDTYDADDQLVLSTDADSQSTLTCYDGDGNVAETVPPVGVAANSLTAASCLTSYPTDYGDRLATDATTTAYNNLGHKTTVTTPAPAGLTGHETTTYAYDLAGRLTSVTAPPTSNTGGTANNVTTYTYDAAGEMLTTTTGSGSGVASTSSYCFDPNGNKTASVAPDGNTTSVATCGTSSPWDTSSSYQTTYSYDSLGEVVTTTRPVTSAATSGQITTNTYDADGNVLTSVSPDSVTTTNTYTPLDQVATISYSGDTADAVTDTYNANGDRVQMTDATGTSTYVYDVFDEMTESEEGCGTISYYGYDSLGDQTSITYSSYVLTIAPTDVVKYAYDAAEEMTSIRDFNNETNAVTNNADGLATSLSLGTTGDTIDTTYDATDSPSEIALDTGGTSQQSFSYSDVPSTQIAAETDTPSIGTLSPADYTYDNQGRVTKDTPGSSSAKSYTEDASGNLTTLPTGASATIDDASELTSSTSSGTTTSYSYDADGSRTAESVSGTGTMAATYSAPNYLTSYNNSLADMTSAIYDGDGLRIQESTTFTDHTSATDQYQYDQSTATPLLLADNEHDYIYGPNGEPFEQLNSGGSMNYLTTDAIDSLRGVTNATGSLVASTSYDVWGNPENTDVRGFTFLGFAGGYADATGLDYFINRYYDRTTGQFISVDPMVDETGQPYAYTGDNPVNVEDPTGLIDCSFGSTATGSTALRALSSKLEFDQSPLVRSLKWVGISVTIPKTLLFSTFAANVYVSGEITGAGQEEPIVSLHTGTNEVGVSASDPYLPFEFSYSKDLKEASVDLSLGNFSTNFTNSFSYTSVSPVERVGSAYVSATITVTVEGIPPTGSSASAPNPTAIAAGAAAIAALIAGLKKLSERPTAGLAGSGGTIG